ncbi:MAG: putative 3-methyladenine glycosylase [Bacteroidetes bacterium]|jgi:DNA-3-methyladenine glycosylase|nr:putative 3-methyladenine glycosylase [Bacteroidota bacterium]
MKSTRRVLSRRYFSRPTLTVARSLVGKYLIRCIDGREIAGKIIEVEAYVGSEDKACHASKGRTQRTDVMFGPAGIAYVYLIYGMYHCLNVVTEREEFPSAVLIRAIEIDGKLIDGPGRLCRAMQIDLSLNRADLTMGESLWFEDRGASVKRGHVGAHPRIGVDYAGAWAKKLWRFRLRKVAAGTQTGRTKTKGHRINPVPPVETS